jgi:homoserine dehydrogenase
MKQKISIGVIGLGTVGAGVVKILQSNGELIERRLGVPIHIVKAAVRDAAGIAASSWRREY